MGLFDNKYKLNLELERNGTIDWAAIVNGPFLDMALYDGELNVDMDQRRMTIWDEGDARISALTMTFIGAALVSLLVKYSQAPDEYRNRVYYISEASFTQRELLAFLERHVGTWTTDHTTVQEQLDEGAKCMESGNVMGAIQPLWFAAGFKDGGGDFLDGRDSNEVLGLGAPNLDRAWGAIEEWGRLLTA